METKKTAVEYLEEKMFYWLSPAKIEPLLRYIEQAKAMEKEQIEDAFFDGDNWGKHYFPEEYYNETYGK